MLLQLGTFVNEFITTRQVTPYPEVLLFIRITNKYMNPKTFNPQLTALISCQYIIVS